MVATHLRALQALELAIRKGSLTEAADELGITPAAVGQRIRSLEEFLDTDLVVRGRKGTRPTPELAEIFVDLQLAFQTLDRVTEALNFQKATAVHIVADLDFADLWLAPRLHAFRQAHPKVLFCINGEGDVPSRVGAPDIRIERGAHTKGDPLFSDFFVPVCDPRNMWRVGHHDAEEEMEGVALLHVQRRDDEPDWEAWFNAFGLRRSGLTRGQRFRNARLALDATRNAVGFMLCGLSLLEEDLRSGALTLPYPASMGLASPCPYRLWARRSAATRPQVDKFLDWLAEEARATQAFITKQSSSA